MPIINGRRDKILSLALNTRDNENPEKNDLIQLQVNTENQAGPFREYRRSSSFSSSSSSDSSSSSSSLSFSSSNVNAPYAAQDTQQSLVVPCQDEYNLTCTPLVRQRSLSSESIISNSITESPHVTRIGNVGLTKKHLHVQEHPHFGRSRSSSLSGDFSPDDNDPDYQPQVGRTVEESSDSDSVTSNRETNNVSPQKKRRKGVINSKKIKAKKLRNSGAEYVSLSKSSRVVPARQMKPPCGTKCRLQCFTQINEEERKSIFNTYWNLASLTRQRDFIASCMTVVQPRYQYKKLNNSRNSKHAFYFQINDKKLRVCKIFFKNTLGINDRPIRTVIDKMTDHGVVEEEKRGKHGKQRKVADRVIQDIKNHIESIPRIESHYLRQQTSREYIDGGKNLADLYRDYKKKCAEEGVEAAEEHTYRKVFTKEFNISFFIPKKDMCELCTIYRNLDSSERETMERKYIEHHEEKRLSRLEKEEDKKKINNNVVVACYDLQAVLPLPMCKTSAFYYKSKLNVCNFTICELSRDYCECYVWSEIEGLRGANEIGSCVLSYLKNKSESPHNDNLEIVFYSDNCCGQQKNQYMFSMYMYAITNYKINSITHKFLITGHTQNENDNVHSVIEKQVKKFLKSSPIYVPEQYMTLIQTARKKGTPYKVKGMTHSDFFNLKDLAQECGSRFNKNSDGETVRLSDIKIIKFQKGINNDVNVYYKNSYSQHEFKQLCPERPSRQRSNRSRLNFELKNLYNSRLELTARKKSDLKSLVDNNLIPRYHAVTFYNTIV